MKKRVRIGIGSILTSVLLLILSGSGHGLAPLEKRVARYNGPGNGWDYAEAIAVDGSGNVYVTGTSEGSGTEYDYATIKYGPNGKQLWVKRYNGPGNRGDSAKAIAVDGSGNVYVTGTSYYDYATIKYSTNGKQLWVKRYNGPGNGTESARALAVDGSGNVYITGWSEGSNPWGDYATIKYNTNGKQLWVARYNGPGNDMDAAYAIAVDSSGNVYVTGTSEGSGTEYDYATIKYSTNGKQLWVARYNGSDGAYAIALDGSGNVYVTGSSPYDYATIKYGPNGKQLWVARYNGPGNDLDKACAIAVDGSGNVYVTGRSMASGGTNEDYVTIKYNTNGKQLWVARYNGPGNDSDYAFAIAVDGSGNVYVTGGQSFGRGTDQDYATIKYGPNGKQLWVKRYNGPGNGDNFAEAIAVDASGNAYVTGESMASEGTNEDYVTIKY